MGVSGASGLLALLYPKKFGTVDQFVISALKELGKFPELTYIDPKCFSVELAVFIIRILQDKAQELNRKFKTDLWTPRTIDMILWAYRNEVIKKE